MTVVPFPWADRERPAGAARIEDELEQFADARRRTIQNLERTIACLNAVRGTVDCEIAGNLLRLIVSDLKSIKATDLTDKDALLEVHTRLKDCLNALSVSSRTIRGA